jgi:hypothetical protein
MIMDNESFIENVKLIFILHNNKIIYRKQKKYNKYIKICKNANQRHIYNYYFKFKLTKSAIKYNNNNNLERTIFNNNSNNSNNNNSNNNNGDYNLEKIIFNNNKKIEQKILHDYQNKYICNPKPIHKNLISCLNN